MCCETNYTHTVASPSLEASQRILSNKSSQNTSCKCTVFQSNISQSTGEVLCMWIVSDKKKAGQTRTEQNKLDTDAQVQPEKVITSFGCSKQVRKYSTLQLKCEGYDDRNASCCSALSLQTAARIRYRRWLQGTVFMGQLIVDFGLILMKRGLHSANK